MSEPDPVMSEPTPSPPLKDPAELETATVEPIVSVAEQLAATQRRLVEIEGMGHARDMDAVRLEEQGVRARALGLQRRLEAGEV